MRRNAQQRQFGEWLDITLSNRGILGRVLAEALGVNESTVSRWRSGAGVPDSETVENMADFLGLDRMRLLVTAGALSANAARVDPYAMPEPTALRASVKRQIEHIRGLSDEGIQALLSTYDELISGE